MPTCSGFPDSELARHWGRRLRPTRHPWRLAAGAGTNSAQVPAGLNEGTPSARSSEPSRGSREPFAHLLLTVEAYSSSLVRSDSHNYWRINRLRFNPTAAAFVGY